MFPIYLKSFVAKRLCEEHCSQEFFDFHKYNHYAEYNFTAKMFENGEVEVFVHYTSNDGFCLSCGPAFTKIIKPFNDLKVAQIIEDEKFRLAEEKYDKLQQQKKNLQILKLKREMFK